MRCRGCRTDIDVDAVDDVRVRADAAKLCRRARPMEAIALVQRSAKLDIRRAKAIVLHVTKEPARCHRCGEPVVPHQTSVCAACGRVNVDW
jgi:hypothetical protein